ncbi:MAG: zinc ribbon domain-containing protein [Ignavibacteria bacterium]|jgi:putative FmdB family regulatory protein|nr:zinc ribbon domain-containing protein [Ignavibacteria bacterium]MCU7504870.1 zinc ribbon domain-containing protein [Ignavibacteria bacterium]MCU7518318.1 zinc ribbon domain-containing protein [Ignavibacteria bacterium]
MPTYDYKCTECGYVFEHFQKMTDEPLKNCPQCKGKLKRLIGPGLGPIFKGTGFYETDYKHKGNSSTSNK